MNPGAYKLLVNIYVWGPKRQFRIETRRDTFEEADELLHKLVRHNQGAVVMMVTKEIK